MGDGEADDRMKSGASGETKFRLVGLAEGRGFDAAGAEGGGKFFGEAVNREHALRLDELDEAEEGREIGVVGEREGGGVLRAVEEAGVEGPAGDGGGAGGRDALEEAGGVGRADDDVAGVRGGVEFGVNGEIEAELRADPGETVRLGLQHDRQPGPGEGAENFLAFTEAVAEEDGRRAGGQGVAAKGDEVGDDFGGGREDVAREAEGGLHDEGVGAGCRAQLGGVAGV